LLAEAPECADCGVAGEMDFVRPGGNEQHQLAAAVEFADQRFGVEKPRVRQSFGRSLIGCHLWTFWGHYVRVSTRKM
jgi:hypothetical protein